MQEDIREIIEKAKAEGHEISDQEAVNLLSFCERKMEIAGIEDREAYRPILFEDELKDFFIRRGINTVTMAVMALKKEEKHVCVM